MYGKAFCVLIIALIFIYNLATGSAETVTSPNNESLTSWATYGTLVQAGAAVITLGIMVWLGYQQKAMTRRQINLSLYEKRYKIYTQVLQFSSAIGALRAPVMADCFNCFDNFDYNVYPSPDCDKKLADIVNRFCSDSGERTFLLPDEINSYIDGLLENARLYYKILRKYPVKASSADWDEYGKQTFEAQEKFACNEKEIYEEFALVLDFKNI